MKGYRPPKKQDYYELLGVPRDASPADIKRAYRRKAREYHPDVSYRCDAHDKFSELGKAYEVLKDPDKRKEYDVHLMEKIFHEEVSVPAKKRTDKIVIPPKGAGPKIHMPDVEDIPDIVRTFREVLVIVISTVLVILYLFSI